MDRRTFIVLAIGLAVIAAAVLVFVIASREPNVEALIDSYRQRPTQEKADELAAMIEACSVSADDGGRILEALLKPEVKMREAYLVGKRIGVDLVVPYAVNLHDMMMELEQTMIMGEMVMSGGLFGRGRNAVLAQRIRLELEPVAEEGRHAISVAQTLKLKSIPMRFTRKWRWPGNRRFPMNLLPRKSAYWFEDTRKGEYECRLMVAFDVNVVASEEAPDFTVRRGQELDRMMRACFTSDQQDYNSESDTMKYRGGIVIKHHSLPERVCFRIIFRDADGQEYPSGDDLTIAAGRAGSRPVTPTVFGIREPGRHKGALILRPDPDRAYCDPSINSIWGGELEFPMEIEVEAPKPEAKQP